MLFAWDEFYICLSQDGHTKMGILVSLYAYSGDVTHIYLKRGEVLKVDRFYHDLHEEELLKDKSNFMLFVASGKLDQWLAIPDTFDVSEPDVITEV